MPTRRASKPGRREDPWRANRHGKDLHDARSWHLPGLLLSANLKLAPGRVRMSKAQQIVEVSPPEWTHPECWDDKAEVQAELLPVASIAHELKTPMVVML